jgi:hypothetical protein
MNTLKWRVVPAAALRLKRVLWRRKWTHWAIRPFLKLWKRQHAKEYESLSRYKMMQCEFCKQEDTTCSQMVYFYSHLLRKSFSAYVTNSTGYGIATTINRTLYPQPCHFSLSGPYTTHIFINKWSKYYYRRQKHEQEIVLSFVRLLEVLIARWYTITYI